MMTDSIKTLFSRQNLQQAGQGFLFLHLYFGNQIRTAQKVLAHPPLSLGKGGSDIGPSQFLRLGGGDDEEGTSAAGVARVGLHEIIHGEFF